VRDGRRPVGGPVVDHDHFEARIVQPPQAFQAVADGPLPVATADHYRDGGPGPVCRERHVGEGIANGCQGGLRPPPAVGQAEVPVFDVVATAVPLIGPGEHKGACAAGRECRSHLPVDGPGLGNLAVPAAVQPDLGDDQGPVAREVLEPGEVGLEAVLCFKVDVERGEVHERYLQVLGRGIAHVSNETFGILGLRRPA
jgi:hypothetical protein